MQRKFVLMLIIAIPIFLLSCNEGRKTNQENYDKQEKQENKGTNQGMDRDTLSQGSLIMNFRKQRINVPSQMEAAHEKDINLFQKQAEEGDDPELKAFASKNLPVLEMHRDSVKAIQLDLR